MHNHLKTLARLGLAALPALLAWPAWAGDGVADRFVSGPVHDACAGDLGRLEQLCPGMHPGDGQFHLCARQHPEAMSPGCRAALKQWRAEHPEQRGKKLGKVG